MASRTPADVEALGIAEYLQYEQANLGQGGVLRWGGGQPEGDSDENEEAMALSGDE